MKLILSILLLALTSDAATYLNHRRKAFRPVAATAEFLTDRWYFSNVFPTNNGVFGVGFEGTGTRTIDWGDGSAETVCAGTLVTNHTYSVAASNVFSIRGSMTRLYFYQMSESAKLKRILTEPNGITGLTSLLSGFRSCSGLIGNVPPIAKLTGLTTLAFAFNSSAGLTGSIPSLDGLTNLTTLNSAFTSCTGFTGSIPSLSDLTNLITITTAFKSCTGVTGDFPPITNLFKLTDISEAFRGCTLVTGSIPSLSGLTNLTTILNTFRDNTGLNGTIPSLSDLTNLTTMAGAFRDSPSLTGSFPSLSGLTKLTTIVNAFQNSGCLNNTSKIDFIFGAGNFENLTTANSCFSVANGSLTNLLGNISDFTNKTFHATFTVGIGSGSSSYRMFFNQTNVYDMTGTDGNAANWK